MRINLISPSAYRKLKKERRDEVRNKALKQKLALQRQKRDRLTEWHKHFVIFPRRIKHDGDTDMERATRPYIFLGTVMRKAKTVSIIEIKDTGRHRLIIGDYKYKDPQDHLADKLSSPSTLHDEFAGEVDVDKIRLRARSRTKYRADKYYVK